MKKTSLLFILVLVVFSSCVPVKKLKYTVDESSTKNNFYNVRSEKTIQPYDYLYIKIYSLDEKTSVIFEQDNRYGNTDEQLISYEVNDNGYIDFPFIGDIYVKDLTISEAKDKIEQSLNQYLSRISVRVRFVGNKITVIGEVNRPGSYTFYDEKITIFQGLSLADDIANYGDKTKVTLIREKDNQISYHYLDLTRKDIVTSEYYYLLPNDIIMIDPVRAKYRALRDYSAIYLLFSGVTTFIAVLSLLQ